VDLGRRLSLIFPVRVMGACSSASEDKWSSNRDVRHRKVTFIKNPRQKFKWPEGIIPLKDAADLNLIGEFIFNEHPETKLYESGEKWHFELSPKTRTLNYYKSESDMKHGYTPQGVILIESIKGVIDGPGRELNLLLYGNHKLGLVAETTADKVRWKLAIDDTVKGLENVDHIFAGLANDMLWKPKLAKEAIAELRDYMVKNEHDKKLSDQVERVESRKRVHRNSIAKEVESAVDSFKGETDTSKEIDHFFADVHKDAALSGGKHSNAISPPSLRNGKIKSPARGCKKQDTFANIFVNSSRVKVSTRNLWGVK